MDANSLHFSLELVSGLGQGMSSEQKAALRASLVLLQRDYRFTRVLFWGRIQGLQADYYIAQGCGEDQLHNRSVLYSLNCLDWSLLPPATENMILEASEVIGRFIGDPSHEYEYASTRNKADEDKADEDDPVPDEEEIKSLKEEARLVATIALIDQESAVVPRGAYVKSPHGQVELNRSFQGLSMTEARKLTNYFHCTPTLNPQTKTLEEKAELDPAIDFLNSLEHDIPRGSWSLQFEGGNTVLVLRSLLWPGLTFFHMPMTPHHGHIYIGNGQRNIDLPFML
ncbi:radial spoke head protein 9 homolog [Microcaecilia unicolor]|uniref:Radial spoke head protein 9 homolog n=1 Tax=Microcaecilia unicolor TaxID=1415580 RepID=A0A6P7X7R0_9AMPH|nr:radial spoke head protein 9 homolog [Microcaecilia unicolor]